MKEIVLIECFFCTRWVRWLFVHSSMNFNMVRLMVCLARFSYSWCIVRASSSTIFLCESFFWVYVCWYYINMKWLVYIFVWYIDIDLFICWMDGVEVIDWTQEKAIDGWKENELTNNAYIKYMFKILIGLLNLGMFVWYVEWKKVRTKIIMWCWRCI